MMKKISALLAGAATVLNLLGCQSEGQAREMPATDMIRLTRELKEYGREHNKSFLLVGNGSAGLLEVTEENPIGNVITLLAQLDGIFVESVFYGGDMEDDVATDDDTTRFFEYLLARAQRTGMPVLNLDYCSDPENVRRSMQRNKLVGYVGMTSGSRALDEIPHGDIPHENTADVKALSDVKNFLVILNPEQYRTREAFLDAIAATNYDLIVVDLYYGVVPYTPREVARLKRKANGGERIVLSYMSVGEAETYRPYWKQEWQKDPPSWIAAANDDWEDNYKVRYWTEEWKHILFGTPDAYLDRILAAGFDGAFLDVMDAWYYFVENPD